MEVFAVRLQLEFIRVNMLRDSLQHCRIFVSQAQ
jgi:hypothetical protein